jgi:glutathione synthase/RimK-type ligase-like ATP-grasp enzyme
MPRVAYVTYRQEPDRPDPDIDIPWALPALAARGVSTDVVFWDDPLVDWAVYDLVLLRSAWDYVPRFDEFMTWARRVSGLSRLMPPLEVIERNTDKRYLRDLADAGVPVVPTHWIEPGRGAVDVDLQALPWSRVVVKPAVSSGSRDTIVTSDRAEVEAQVDLILASGRPVLVQPYLDAVDHDGEVAVVVIDGVPSHAIRKVPALSEGGYGDASDHVEITPELASAVERVLAAEPTANGLSFARVDLVRGDDGQWLVMELELTEPLLFLGYAGEAPERFAAAVVATLG